MAWHRPAKLVLGKSRVWPVLSCTLFQKATGQQLLVTLVGITSSERKSAPTHCVSLAHMLQQSA